MNPQVPGHGEASEDTRKTLRLPTDVIAAILRHALADHPVEACGVVAGRSLDEPPTRWIPLRNAAASEVFYEVASADLLALYRELDELGELPVVVYHSHTRTAAYPSRTDVELAAEPEAHYVLVSTPEVQTLGPEFPDISVGWRPGPELRAFRIVDGTISEVPITAV